jgi:hypothetical protein
VSLFVWLLPLDLSGMGDLTSSYATAGVALRVSGALKPHHHNKVETPPVGSIYYYSDVFPRFNCSDLWSLVQIATIDIADKNFDIGFNFHRNSESIISREGGGT